MVASVEKPRASARLAQSTRSRPGTSSTVLGRPMPICTKVSSSAPPPLAGGGQVARVGAAEATAVARPAAPAGAQAGHGQGARGGGQGGGQGEAELEAGDLGGRVAAEGAGVAGG